MMGDLSPAEIEFDIGLSDDESRGGYIKVDHIAQAILNTMPSYHRKSFMRAVNNAELLLDENIKAGYADGEYEVLRAKAHLGERTLHLKIRLCLRDDQTDNSDSEEDEETVYELKGSIYLHQIFRVEADFCALHSAPDAYKAAIAPGTPMTDVLDLPLLKNATVGNVKPGGVIAVTGPQPKDYHNFIADWFS